MLCSAAVLVDFRPWHATGGVRLAQVEEGPEAVNLPHQARGAGPKTLVSWSETLVSWSEVAGLRVATRRESTQMFATQSDCSQPQ